MKYKVIELHEPITIYGVQGKATLERENHLETSLIPFIWDFVNSEAYPEDDQKEGFYGVYEHEKPDAQSPFRFTAGATFPTHLKETDIEEAVLAQTQIEPGKYLVVESVGKLAETPIKLWLEAEQFLQTPDCPYERVYMTDFEEYLDYNPDRCDVRVHISVREKHPGAAS